MLGLLQRKFEPRGRLDVRCATQVFDAVPCNVLNHWKSMISSSMRRASSRPNKSRSSCVPLAGDCINCFLIIGNFRMQFMIMSKSAIYTVCMYVVIVGLAVSPLLKSCLAMGESCSAHRAGGTLAFACWRLCTDTPLAASSTNCASRRGDIMHCWCIRHRNV